MKKGFTLIELLSIIVILAVVAIITASIVNNITEKTNRAAFNDSLYSVKKSAELYFFKNTSSTQDKVKTVDVKDLKMKNNNFKYGMIELTKDNRILLYNISDGKYCGNSNMDGNSFEIYPGECDTITPTCEIVVRNTEKNENGWYNEPIVVDVVTSKAQSSGLSFALFHDAKELSSGITSVGKVGIASFLVNQTYNEITFDGAVKNGVGLGNVCTSSFKIDLEKPNVEVSKDRRFINFSVSDNIGVGSYIVSMSDVPPTTDWISYTDGDLLTYESKKEGIYYVYVKDIAGNITKSEGIEIYHHELFDYALEKKSYVKGESVLWAGLTWFVLKDSSNEDEYVKLILQGNYTTGEYSSISTEYEGSTAFNFLNTNFVNTYESIKKAQAEGSMKSFGSYNDKSYYIDLPSSSDLDTTIKNTSETSFWTKTAEGSKMIFGNKTGIRGSVYSISSSVTRYNGFGCNVSSKGCQGSVNQSTYNTGVSKTDTAVSITSTSVNADYSTSIRYGSTGTNCTKSEYNWFCEYTRGKVDCYNNGSRYICNSDPNSCQAITTYYISSTSLGYRPVVEIIKI